VVRLLGFCGFWRFGSMVFGALGSVISISRHFAITLGVTSAIV
jgi:hypothetical protein